MSDAPTFDPTTEATVSPLPGIDPTPVYVGPSTRKLVAFGAMIAVVAGLAGAVAAWAAFPPANGKIGARGPVGAVGPVGPQGPAGSAADVQAAISKLGLDTGKVGYCFSTTSSSNNGAYWITNVALNPPVDNSGTLSCPTGQFVSLTPNSPQFTPVAGYNPLTGTSSTGQ